MTEYRFVIEWLRLLAVPLFAWAAWWDWKARRVPVELWGPLVLFGAALLAIEAFHTPAVLLGAAVTVGILVPISYGLFRLGAVGGADTKALIALAFVYPHAALVMVFIGTLANVPLALLDRVTSNRGCPYLVGVFVGIIVGYVIV